MSPPATVDRAFVRIEAGLIHYRHAGDANASDAPPLYMAHGGPGSSLGLAPLIAELGVARRVIAPDMMGNGDSDPPDRDRTDVAFYVDGVVRVLDQLQIAQVDFYGDHTGAQIGCELALTHPERVRGLILNGVALFPPELKAAMIAHYAPPVTPDEFGGHLAWAWSFVRELTLHFPHFMRDPAHRLNHVPVPSAEARQRLAVELLKALPTYHLAYQAVFAHETAERLPLLRHQTLVMGVRGDPLADYLDQAAMLVPGCAKALVDRERRGASIEAFLNRLPE